MSFVKRRPPTRVNEREVSVAREGRMGKTRWKPFKFHNIVGER